MAIDDKMAIGFATDSGFPLQIALQHAVDSNVQKTGWRVRMVEHGWVHPRDRETGGYIDLVLVDHSNRHNFVVECKRQRDAAMVFMHHKGVVSERRHARVFVTDVGPSGVKRNGWHDVQIDPKCAEVTFCAVRGQGPNEKNTLLERVGSELVMATEALAATELSFRATDKNTARMYVPVIVTTAELKVAEFGPETVSLQDGELKDAKMHSVPWVRLRKQLGTSEFVAWTPDMFGDTTTPDELAERTMFVVNAANLLNFLTITVEDPTLGTFA